MHLRALELVELQNHLFSQGAAGSVIGQDLSLQPFLPHFLETFPISAAFPVPEGVYQLGVSAAASPALPAASGQHCPNSGSPGWPGVAPWQFATTPPHPQTVVCFLVGFRKAISPSKL